MMHRAVGLGVGLICVVALATPAYASSTTYYVDAVTGDDARRGTSPEQAWATVGRVNAQDLEPGDRVRFRGGQTFTGTLTLDATDAGTQRRQVEVDSFGAGRATIAAGKDRGVVVHNAGGIELRDLRVVGTSRGSGELVNGIELFTDLDGATKLPHLRIDKVDVSGFRGAGVMMSAWPADGSKSGFRDVRITEVTSHHKDDAGIASFGYWDTDSTAWAHEKIYIGHSRMYSNSGVAGKGAHSGSGLVLGDVDGAVVERNVAYDNGANNDNPGGGPVGIWTWDSNRVVIQHNESYGNKSKTADGGGFDLDGGVTNSVLQYNYSHDNAGAGILLAQFPGARPFRDNVVRYNISENDGRQHGYASIHLWNGGSGLTDTLVHNNTAFVSREHSPDGAAVRFWSTTNNLRFVNNIFVTDGLPHVDAPEGTTAGSVFRGNSYWSGKTGAVDIRWNSHTYPTLDAWRDATGQEHAGERAVGSSADPRLVAPGAGGAIGDPDKLWRLRAYQLRPHSPLRDAGLAADGFRPARTDFFGTSLPQGSHLDVGAHELSDQGH